jgi:hypothetical protein
LGHDTDVIASLNCIAIQSCDSIRLEVFVERTLGQNQLAEKGNYIQKNARILSNLGHLPLLFVVNQVVMEETSSLQLDLSCIFK